MKNKVTILIVLVLLLVILIKRDRPVEEKEKSETQLMIQKTVDDFQRKYNDIADDEDWQLFEKLMNNGG